MRRLRADRRRRPRAAYEFRRERRPVPVALVRRFIWRMLNVEHPMIAHGADSRGMVARGQSIRHARAWMDDYITAERRGRESLRRFLLDLDAKEANQAEESRSLAEVLELYLSANAHPSNQGGLAPATYERYRLMIGKHLTGNRKPAEQASGHRGASPTRSSSGSYSPETSTHRKCRGDGASEWSAKGFRATDAASNVSSCSTISIAYREFSPTMYWGAWVKNSTGEPPFNMAAQSVFETNVGQSASIIHWSSPFASQEFCNKSGIYYCEFQTKEFETIRSHGSIPFFSWATGGVSGSDKQIAEGSEDSYIEKWALAAKSWGHPFFLRFSWEMNASWFRWGQGHHKEEEVSKGVKTGKTIEFDLVRQDQRRTRRLADRVVQRGDYRVRQRHSERTVRSGEIRRA